MKCKVYGFDIKHCACEKQECCMMLSCAECLTLHEEREKKKDCCGQCHQENLVSLGFSKETEELAKRVVEKCSSCKNEDINKWAVRLANDVCNATD